MFRRLNYVVGYKDLNPPSGLVTSCSQRGVFLSKMAEQGFGIPARELALAGRTLLPVLQSRVEAILMQPAVRQEFESAYRMERSRLLLPNGVNDKKMTVNLDAAVALMDLLRIYDQFAQITNAGLSTTNDWTPFTRDDYPYFTLIYGLELAGVLGRINEVFIDNSCEWGGGPDFDYQRQFPVNSKSLTAYLEKENLSLDALVSQISNGRDWDASSLASNLLDAIKRVEAPAHLKLPSDIESASQRLGPRKD